MTFDITMLLILGGVALVAGFIDTLAGGGGLITVPMLMLMQVPPIGALATNKLQGCSGTLMSTFTLWRKGLLDLKSIRRPFCYVLAGSAIGTLLVQGVNPKALEVLVPIVLAFIALYFLLAPGAGAVERKPRISERLYERCVTPVIGFYDGFFGPGTGSFFSLAEVSLRGRKLIAATAHAKAFNLASNLASLIIFICSGKVLWVIGLTMLVGQVIGAYLGSLAVIGGGARLIRPLIVVMCLAMLIRYTWQHGLFSGWF